MTDDSQITHGRTPLQQNILNDFFDEGLSLDILVAKYCRSETSLVRLITPATKAGRKRLKPPADRRSALNSPPLARVHKRIGMRFIRWRTIENGYDMPEAAEVLGTTLNRLHAIEAGIHNWTLLELVFQCDRMNWSLIDLLRGADLGDYFQPDPS